LHQLQNNTATQVETHYKYAEDSLDDVHRRAVQGRSIQVQQSAFGTTGISRRDFTTLELACSGMLHRKVTSRLIVPALRLQHPKIDALV
jgi:hypothetical protein